MMRRTLLCLSAAALAACSSSTPAAKQTAPSAAAREAFNRSAAELNLPLFWAADKDGDGAAQPEELVVLFGVGPSAAYEGEAGLAKRAEAIAAVARYEQEGPKDAGEDEARQAAVRLELSQGRPTLVYTSLKEDSPAEQAMLAELLKAAPLVEQIYQKQKGSYGLKAADPASRQLMVRNQGPWCEAPKTEGDENCSAMESLPPKVSGLYPPELQTPGFCDRLPEALRGHFSVVVNRCGSPEALPYPKAYPEMKQVAAHLRAAAKAIAAVPEEAALHAYLLAAAQAFTDNSWPAADEAWAKMSVHNSKWYLRVGPDEVYFEPCNLKAGFHMNIARINKASLKWQNLLDPVKQQLEERLAALAGPPYKAREVSFHLPDFIDIVLNVGDARSPTGATIGQSLPNWGPVANEGRGRTVAMTNLYSDADSMAQLEQQASSVLCPETMQRFIADPEPQVMSTVLHEASHNLGPAHEYKVDGETGPEVFGGPLASTMEELKAQTAALYFTDWLAAHAKITKEQATQAHIRDMLWAFGHISRGMVDAEGKAKPYSQLAAIQVGALMKAGVVAYFAPRTAANGQDEGCFEIYADRFAPPVRALMQKVAQIKAKGDKAGAEALKAAYVDAAEVQPIHELIRERWLRAPKASFVYAIER